MGHNALRTDMTPSSWLRRVAIGIGVLILLLVIAAGIFVATFDANRYKPLAVDWMKSTYDRTLVVNGPIELSFLPRLALKVSGVSVSEAGRADPFVRIDTAALAVRVLPLLHKESVVDRISASGVSARYVRDAQGRRNFDDLLSTREAGTAPAGPDENAAALRFDVSGIELDGVQLDIRDDQAGVSGKVAVQSFSSGRLAPQVESPVSLKATVQLIRPEAMKLALEGGMTLILDLAKNAVGARNLKLDVKGDAASVKKLSLALTGALAWDGSALRAGPLQVALQGARLDAAELAPSTLKLQQALYDPAKKQLQLEALELALAGKQGGNPFELSLAWPKLSVDGEQLAGGTLSGRFKLAGPTALAGTFQSAAPSGNFDALRLPGVMVKLDGTVAKRKISGTAKTDLVLHPDRKAAAFEQLDVQATLDDPGLKALALAIRGSGGFDAQLKTARWAFNGSLNSNRFETNGQATLAGARPDVEATAQFDSLDLNQLLAPEKPAPTAAAPADQPVQLDRLEAIDGKFGFTAGSFAFRQYRVADAKIDASLEDGTLRIARLTGRTWGGTIDASGSAAAKSHRIAVKLAANGVDVNAMLKDVAGKDLLEGRGRVTADVTTVGTSLGALRSNLGGSAALQLRNGAIKGINLARSFRQAKAALTMRPDTVSKATATEKTDFTELTASARIANGVAASDDLQVKSPFLRIGGDGRFDVGRGRVDYTARATVTDTAAGQGGAELRALRGVTIPVLLTGPFDAIDWKIEWSEVAAAAVRNQLKDRLADKIGSQLGLPQDGGAASQPSTKPKDALRGVLKGLFK